MGRSLLIFAAAVLAAPVAASAQAPLSPGDYMSRAAASDQFEIQSGQLAEQRAQSPSLKAFGGQMVKDHTQSTQMVTAAAARSNLSAPPPKLDAAQQQKMAQLQSQNGEGFDKLYLTQQLQAHQQALALQSGYAQSGSDPNLKRAAGQIVPVVQMHLSMLQRMSGQ